MSQFPLETIVAAAIKKRENTTTFAKIVTIFSLCSICFFAISNFVLLNGDWVGLYLSIGLYLSRLLVGLIKIKRLHKVIRFFLSVFFSLYVVICVCYILVQLVLTEGALFVVPQKFDKTIWQENYNYLSHNYGEGPRGTLEKHLVKRYKIVKYLESKKSIVGMKKSEVIGLLGEGNNNSSTSLNADEYNYIDPSTYIIYNGGSPDGYPGTYPPFCFAVYFNENVAIRTEIFRQEYCIP